MVQIRYQNSNYCFCFLDTAEERRERLEEVIDDEIMEILEDEYFGNIDSALPQRDSCEYTFLI